MHKRCIGGVQELHKKNTIGEHVVQKRYARRTQDVYNKRRTRGIQEVQKRCTIGTQEVHSKCTRGNVTQEVHKRYTRGAQEVHLLTTLNKGIL